MEERRFYRVGSDPYDAPLNDYLHHGYEERIFFLRSVRRLCKRWGGRVGEAVGSRHGFLFLRFHDTPGGRPEEAWLPEYLLKEAPVPDGLLQEESSDSVAEELDRIFGFD